MFSYRSPSLAEFAEQLKRGPKRLRLRQLASIEFLVSLLSNGRSLPLDFITHNITGYRARPRQEQPDSPLLDVETLQSDLVTLAEDLSADADLLAAHWADPLFSVGELAQRFDVSTKTIFRWHRRGLVGWRMRFDDRRQRLVFSDRCIRRFVAENADLVNRGSSFSQLTSQERDQILSRARELAESGRRTVNAVAKVIAQECGRAVETIRLIIKHHDDSHPKAGIFNRSALQVEAGDQRLAVWEAYVDGASIDALARRFEKPAAWIYRTLTQMRARSIQSRAVEYIPSAEFARADAREYILDCPDLRDPGRDRTPEKRIPRDLPAYLQQLFRVPLLTPASEVALFRKLNYLRYLADEARKAIEPETCSAIELDRIESILAEAGETKNRIVQANLRLVVSIAKRHLTPAQDFFELVSDGNLSLMRAVDKFDYSRGFKFSTYASWAVIKNFARTVPDQQHHRDRYQTGREELLEVVPGPQLDEHEEEFLPAIRSVLDRMLDTLDDREKAILRQRYGLDRAGEPQTLEQIGQTFGVSKERIRQLEARAMAKLRADFSNEAQAVLGA